MRKDKICDENKEDESKIKIISRFNQNKVGRRGEFETIPRKEMIHNITHKHNATRADQLN